MLSLGIDTSNYTTSVAVVSEEQVLCDRRILLKTKQGELGLRQSDALYQHWNNLPELLAPVLKEYSASLDIVCVSTRPRPCEDSYMPVFRAGASAAKITAASLGLPLFECSHQEGHILAASIGNPVDLSKPLIAAHLSGGTLEIVEYINGSCRILAETADISFGQLIDRTGVMLGFSFPAGKAVDELALQQLLGGMNRKNPFCPAAVRDVSLNLSGLETQIKRAEGMEPADLCYFLMERIGQGFDKLMSAAMLSSNAKQALISGGVAESRFLRTYFKDRPFFFAKEGYSSDSAIGVALAGIK